MTERLAEFNEQGFTILNGAIEPVARDAVQRECAALVDGLARRLFAEGKIDALHEDAPFDRRVALIYADIPDEAPTIFRPELHREGFFGLFAHERLLDFAESALGPEVRLYPNYSVRPKLPDNARTLVLWHQDAGYTAANADVLRMVNVWTPLVPATVENGCMEIVPGSHKIGVVAHEKREYYLRIAQDVLNEWENRAIPVEMNPGDVLLFSNLLFHRGLPNRSEQVRWSLDFRYQDATQPTMRTTEGHLLRSPSRPDAVVRDAAHWASLAFR